MEKSEAPQLALRKMRWTEMAMEELLAVQELEKRLAERYAEAQAEAKKRIAVEQRACARLLEDNRRNCDVDAQQKMTDAEQRAQRQTDEILAKARGECEKMQQAARAKLDRAAQWIAEEVVKSEWQS